MRTSLWLWLAYLDTVYLPQPAPYMTLAKPAMSTQVNTLKSIAITYQETGKIQGRRNAIARTVPWSEHISEGLGLHNRNAAYNIFFCTSGIWVAFIVSAHQMLYSYTKTL